jgi:uridylate kinase
MECNALLKGTKVDGVYSADPKKDPNAVRYDTLDYMEVLSKDLKVMDAAAISLARENHIPILVFSVEEPGAFAAIFQGKGHFTTVTDGKKS